MIKRMKSKDTSGLLDMPMATRVLIKDRLKLIEVGPTIRTGFIIDMFRDGKQSPSSTIKFPQIELIQQ